MALTIDKYIDGNITMKFL